MDYREAQKILDQHEAAKATVEKYSKLDTAHEQLGFNSRMELIKALQEMERSTANPKVRKSGRRGRKPGVKRAQRSGSENSGSKRGRLTPEARQELESHIKDGKPASEIAKQFGISLPYVYALKRGLKP